MRRAALRLMIQAFHVYKQYDREATALYLFPTKALTQDQLKGLTRLATGHPDLLRALAAGVYDGDTQTATRRKLRDTANVILSNPDMLHQGILPAHSKWARFLSRLSYIVVDEMHAYRGIFGSHVANVMRRLARLATRRPGLARVGCRARAGFVARLGAGTRRGGLGGWVARAGREP